MLSVLLSESEAFDFALKYVVSDDEAASNEGEKIGSALKSSPTESGYRFIRTVKELSRKLDCLASKSHEIGGDGREYAMLLLVGAETRKARKKLEKSRKETHITDFLGSRARTYLQIFNHK